MLDLDEVTKQVSKVIAYSQEISHPQVKDIIKDWYAAKHKWIDLMHGELIYEYPEEVKFELDSDAKAMLLDNFIEKVIDFYCNEELSCFLRDISTAEFFDNLTNYEYHEWEITVPANYKVIKAFKFFESNEDKLKEMQNDASMIIQQNVVSGRLCFSVHPLDYLSLSENIHNWRSCHALDGDYRSGNMNYMMDENTVVCYLRAEKQAILPHFPEDVIWNSKKWRVLVFFSDDEQMIFMGRQYPFFSNSGIEIIKEKILPEIIAGSEWDNFHEPVRINEAYDTYSRSKIETGGWPVVPIGRGFLPMKDLVFDGKDTYQFNDLLKSSCYTPIYSYRYNPFGYAGRTSISTTKFHVGKKCRCPSCNTGYISFGEKMLCEDCDQNENASNYFECEMCGCMTNIAYEYTLPYSDMSVCPECFSKYTHTCEKCGIRDIDTYVRYRPEFNNQILCNCCTKLLSIKDQEE